MAAVTIHTTQNVRIDYETASLGLRIGAFTVDAIIVVASYFVILFVLDQASVATDYNVVLMGVIFYCILYFFFSEMLTRGQTAGKAILGLRVMRLDGRELTPADYLTRAIFLLPDVLFTVGILAVLLVTTSGQNQRLGDIVARTVVIATNNRGGVALEDILTIRNREEHQARFPAVQRMTDEDMLLVKQCILRYRRYQNAAHRRALATLSARMIELLEIDPAEVELSEEAFLEALLLDYIVLTR